MIAGKVKKAIQYFKYHGKNYKIIYALHKKDSAIYRGDLFVSHDPHFSKSVEKVKTFPISAHEMKPTNKEQMYYALQKFQREIKKKVIYLNFLMAVLH